MEILGNVGGLQAEFLHFNNREGPCPKCQGQTRYRGLDESTGALFCSHCHCEKNGDGIAALMWLRGWTFRQTVAELAKYLGIDTKAGGNGEAKKANSGKVQTAKKKPLTEMCQTHNDHPHDRSNERRQPVGCLLQSKTANHAGRNQEMRRRVSSVV